jgi:PAS domain S-box-containing protein
VLDTLNLVSKYEKQALSSDSLFDEEKKSLLLDLTAKLNSISEYSFALFNKDKMPIVLNRNYDNIALSGYYRFKNQAYSFVDLNGNTMKANVRGIKEQELNNIVWLEESMSLSLVLVEKLFLNNEHIGYVRLKKRFSQNSMESIALGLNSLFSFALSSGLTLGNIESVNLSVIEQYSQEKEKTNLGQEFYSDEKYYYHSYFSLIDNSKRLYFVLAKEKQSLDNQFVQLIQQLLLSFFIALIVAFLISLLFLKMNVLKPLYELIDGIKHLKNKGYTPIKIQSSNEFSQIANEFNTISYELSQSFEALESSKRFLERLIDSVPVRIFWKDKQGHFLGVNHLLLEDAGLKSKDAILGKTDYDLPWTKQEADAFRADDVEVMSSQKAKKNIQEVQTSSSGEQRILLTSKVPLKNSKGDVIGLLGVYSDITAFKQLQKELKDKELLLMHQSKMAAMGEMLENIAHQWKQPLSLISTISSGLKLKLELNDLSNEYILECSNQIMQATQLLSNTVDDFKDFYKKNKALKRFNVSKLIEQTCKLFSSKIKNRSIDLILELSDYEIVGYEREFVQVVLNILHNAIDAFDANKIEDKIIKITILKEQTKIKIVFQDSAGGIKEEVLPKIFDARFTTKSSQGGSGIGLYMSKLILEKIEASIEAKNCVFTNKNQSHKGACFIISMKEMCDI